MFGNSKKIKELELKITALQNLCSELTKNSIAMTREYYTLAEAVKSLLEHQKIMDRLISTRYSIKAANDDDIIH